MVVANFGMGIRPSSSVVQTVQERKAAYEAEQAAISREAQRVASRMNGNAADLARQNVANTQGLGYSLTPSMIENLTRTLTGAYLGQKNLTDIGASPFQGANASAVSQLGAQREDFALSQMLGDRSAQAQSAFNSNENAIASSQAAQQNAYSAFNTMPTGGVLGRTSQAGMNDPTQPGATMPWNQPWSQAGYGNPGSLGGLGGYKPNAQQGWGSVFGGGRNPWSLA